MQQHKLYLVCTGLGRIKRGFESHILDLAALLEQHAPDIPFQVLVGKRLAHATFLHEAIPHIHRQHSIWRWLRLHPNAAFAREQDFFFLGMIPHLFKNKAALYYLGEYRLYCHLYRFRKWFGLNYKLCLHTGGMSMPGLYDQKKDFVHHVTSIYLNNDPSNQIPAERQFLIPHILRFNYEPNTEIVSKIKMLASNKQIWLSVGSIDIGFKRMNLIPEVLHKLKDKVFPIVIGETNSETSLVIKSFNDHFGEEGYLITKCSREELASFYSIADYFILCTKSEPFGIVFLEALSYNIPVVCNDNKVTREILQEYGIYIDFEDLESAKSKIQELVISKVENNGREYVNNNFSMRVLAPKYINTFKQMLSAS